MHTHSGLAHIILDFDGTCTQIPPVFEKYLDFYRRGLNESGLSVTLSEWRDAQAIVRNHSPKAGWTVAGCPPSAPAAGDPYILADEAARLMLRRRGVTTPFRRLFTYRLTTPRLRPREKKHSIRFPVSWSMACNCILFRIPARHSLAGDCVTCLAITIQ